MDEKPSTVSITPFDQTSREREIYTNNSTKPLITSVVNCQLLLEKGAALLEFKLTLRGKPILVGRASEKADPPINLDFTPFGAIDLGVSRIHARFERSDAKLFLRDLNSTNGTWVNGRRLTAMSAQEISHGDKIDFGRLATKFYIK